MSNLAFMPRLRPVLLKLNIWSASSQYTLLTLKYKVNLLNVPLSSVLHPNALAILTVTKEHVNTFSHRITLTRFLLPQSISFSDTKVLFNCYGMYKRASMTSVYEFIFLVYTSRSTEQRWENEIISFTVLYLHLYIPQQQ